MVKTPIPALGLAGVVEGAGTGDGGADGGTEGGGKKSNCDCSVVGRRAPLELYPLLPGLILAVCSGRRRGRRRR
jgi:hypothetical protein